MLGRMFSSSCELKHYTDANVNLLTHLASTQNLHDCGRCSLPPWKVFPTHLPSISKQLTGS